jgi:N-acetyl-alpha-D-glucosaminyl L-malate synthase BshA
MKVFASVRSEMPAKLLMVGDGPERPVAEELAREFGVFDDIRFVGKQEQMEEILPISDLFLLTSEYESFGLSALEAMAAKVPVISTNAGGLSEINLHGITGYTANVGDVASMSEFAIGLLSNDVEMAKMKEQAFEQANKHDIRNVIPQYEKLYSRFCRMETCG